MSNYTEWIVVELPGSPEERLASPLMGLHELAEKTKQVSHQKRINIGQKAFSPTCQHKTCSYKWLITNLQL